jgi:hypothetical protein
MATSGVGASPCPAQDYNDLLALLKSKNLDTVYLEFMELTNAPPDLKCLLIVAENLHQTFKKLRIWRQIGPFKGWPLLMRYLCLHAQRIQKQFGPVVNPPPPSRNQSAHSWLKKTFRNEFEDRPLYLMLCCTHLGLEVHYGALQLQILYARWAEIQAARLNHASSNPIISQVGTAVTAPSIARHPHNYALAVRDLSGPDFRPLLTYLNSEQLPADFVRSPGLGSFPLGLDYPDRFRRITNYCDRRRGGRQGGPGSGTRRKSNRRRSYPEYVGFNDFRYALKFESDGEGGESGVNQLAIQNRSIPESRALELGLDPQELGNGTVEILNEVPNAASTEEAFQTARAQTRSWEIDKSLFAWNAQALRITELECTIFPALRQACDDKNISSEDLTAAAIVAVAIDTGRDLDRILQLRVESLPESEFAFQTPSKDDPDAWWNWHTIGPLYKSELNEPLHKSEYRASQLRFRAALLVRDLLLKHKSRQKIRVGGEAFRSENAAEWVKDWIAKVDHEHRITLNRLSHLRANELHRITGGERALACLVLGVPQTAAAVELHYTVLSTREATKLFDQSSEAIWGDSCAAATGPTAGADQDAYSGCRAFPTRAAVKHTVRWLRNGSRRFFRIAPNKFDVRRHKQYLNRAVLYLVWHQFIAFGTRAICDAYQENDGFAKSSGVGILSDKDFADGYKTRIILADQTLRCHMSSVEARLKTIAKRLRITRSLPKSSVWFLGPKKKTKAIEITPTNISCVLGEEFPFPVNSPRKVMRNLLRERGVSHEQAEAYMGHWSHGREPWSPYSSFDFERFLSTLEDTIPDCLKELGFKWFPPVETV